LHTLVDSPTRIVEATMLVVANLAATLIRFVLLRTWVFAPKRTH
jgi:putative flippase GtrA